MDKSPEAFRTISEVGVDLDVPQHVLRFWETKFSQIKPMKRAGGRRYYRPNDVDLLRGIRHLLYGEGYTIRGVQKLLRENGASFAVDIGRTGAVPAGEIEIAPATQVGSEAPVVEQAAPVAQSAHEASISDDDKRKLSGALRELEAARILLAKTRTL